MLYDIHGKVSQRVPPLTLAQPPDRANRWPPIYRDIELPPTGPREGNHRVREHRKHGKGGRGAIGLEGLGFPARSGTLPEFKPSNFRESGDSLTTQSTDRGRDVTESGESLTHSRKGGLNRAKTDIGLVTPAHHIHEKQKNKRKGKVGFNPNDVTDTDSSSSYRPPTPGVSLHPSPPDHILRPHTDPASLASASRTSLVSSSSSLLTVPGQRPESGGSTRSQTTRGSKQLSPLARGESGQDKENAVKENRARDNRVKEHQTKEHDSRDHQSREHQPRDNQTREHLSRDLHSRDQLVRDHYTHGHISTPPRSRSPLTHHEGALLDKRRGDKRHKLLVNHSKGIVDPQPEVLPPVGLLPPISHAALVEFPTLAGFGETMKTERSVSVPHATLEQIKSHVTLADVKGHTWGTAEKTRNISVISISSDPGKDVLRSIHKQHTFHGNAQSPRQPGVERSNTGHQNTARDRKRDWVTKNEQTFSHDDNDSPEVAGTSPRGRLPQAMRHARLNRHMVEMGPDPEFMAQFAHIEVSEHNHC